MAKTSKKFTVKAVTKVGETTYYPAVGVAFLNESEKVTIKIKLHMFPGLDLVAFLDEPNKEEAAGEAK